MSLREIARHRTSVTAETLAVRATSARTASSPKNAPRSQIDVLTVRAIHSHLAVFDYEDARSRLPVLNEHMTLRGFELSGERGDVGEAGIIERREDRYASDLVGKIVAHADRVGAESHPAGSAFSVAAKSDQ